MRKLIYTALVIFSFNAFSHAQEQYKGKKVHGPVNYWKSEEERLNAIEQVQAFESENPASRSQGWVTMGSKQTRQNPNRFYTGRINDIEYLPNVGVRVLSANGGLWVDTAGNDLGKWACISEQLPSLSCGAFASNPKNPNTIVLATGDPVGTPGAGVFITYDLGKNWKKLTNTSPSLFESQRFWRVVYNPDDTNIIHVLSNSGYYRSNNAGTTFNRFHTLPTTDLVINPSNPKTLYCAGNNNFLKSTDGGTTWVNLSGAPKQNIGRVSLAVCNLDTNVVWANIAGENRADNICGPGGGTRTRGIFRTTNGGTSWDSATLVNNNNPANLEFHFCQGHYNNSITISPTDCDLVYAGGGTIASNSKAKPMEFDLTKHDAHHVDVHDFAWKKSGNAYIMYVATDGGISKQLSPYTSADMLGTGLMNNMPITQCYDLDVVYNTNGRNMIISTQDNGAQAYNDTLSQTYWVMMLGGDGIKGAINPQNPSEGYVTNQYNDAYKVTRYGKDINSSHNFPGIRPRYNDAGTAYFSDNSDNSIKVKLPTAGFSTLRTFPSAIQHFSISKEGVGGSNIYVTMWNDTFGNRLWVYDRVGGNWEERAKNLFNGIRVEMVVPHPTQSDKAVMITNPSSGSRIYKTDDRGKTWFNITGNLPDALVRNLVWYPYSGNDVMVIGTEDMGFFKTSNGGTTWQRWNKGTPDFTHTKQDCFGIIDSVAANGKFYAVAATWGRGIIKREIDELPDPTAVASSAKTVTTVLAAAFVPGVNTLVAHFGVEANTGVQFTLFDINGRQVHQTPKTDFPEGNQYIQFDVSPLASGTYIVRMTTTYGNSTIKVFKNN